MDKNTLLIQLIGFANTDKQLPLYLETLTKVGLQEIRFTDKSYKYSPLTRIVPNRKWYTDSKIPGKEFLLFHKK